MKLRTRLLATASALTMFAGVGLIASAPAGAVTSFAVGNDHATCNTLSGPITFATAITNGGPTTGANTITTTIALAGCFDDDRGTVKMFKGSSKAVIHTTNGHNCAGLLGPSTVTAATDIVWVPAAGQAFTPKIAVGTVQKMASHVSFSQIGGGAFSVPAANNPWNAAYGYFTLGAPYGLAPLSVSGEFTGGDGGATAWFAGTTQDDITNILTQCGGKGVKTLHFGIGAVHGG
jgi:hypothetical protein